MGTFTLEKPNCWLRLGLPRRQRRAHQILRIQHFPYLMCGSFQPQKAAKDLRNPLNPVIQMCLFVNHDLRVDKVGRRIRRGRWYGGNRRLGKRTAAMFAIAPTQVPMEFFPT